MALQIGISIDEGTGLVTQGPAGLLGKSILATDGDGSALTGLTKTQVGLGNVDNTSDATKNAAVAALTNKDLTSATNTYRAATDAQAGAVELATPAESAAGSNAAVVLTPAARWASQGQFVTIDENWLSSAGVVGSAIAANLGRYAALVAGTTPESQIVRTTSNLGISETGAASTVNRIDYSKSYGLFFQMRLSTASTNGVCRIGIKAAQTFGALSAHGVNVESRNDALWLVVHDGTTLTEINTGSTIDQKPAALSLIFSNGQVDLYRAGVLIGSTALGPTNTNVLSYLNWELTNGADSISYRVEISRHIGLKTM